MAAIIVLILVQIGIVWLTVRLFGRTLFSLIIAILAVLNLCPWFTPYESAKPFLLGQPWWLTLWMGVSILLLVMLYIRLFRVQDRHGRDNLKDLWDEVRALRNRAADYHDHA